MKSFHVVILCEIPAGPRSTNLNGTNGLAMAKSLATIHI